MNEPFTHVSRTIRRVHSKFAREFTVTQFSWDSTGGTNEYADGDWTETTFTIEASIRQPRQSDSGSDAAGQETAHDMELWVNPQDVDVSLGNGENARPTWFTDSTTDRTYEAVGLHDEGSLLKVRVDEVM